MSVQDWVSVKNNLKNTLHSICGQVSDNWHCYIVANEGTELPEVDEHFTIVKVNFPLNHLPDKKIDLQLYYDKVREDKGLRVYEAIKLCSSDDYFMVVDYDDFVHNSLSEFVAQNSTKSGWFISSGYFYSGGGFILKHRHFDKVCGTSNIIKVSFLEQFFDEHSHLPMDKIKELLGSHKFIKDYMKSMNNEYHPLPFPGAIYNIGIPSSTSQTPSIIRRIISPIAIINNPLEFISNVIGLRMINREILASFNFKK